MKTITDYADDYVGHPQEIDEDLSVYQKREAYKAGMEKAFSLISVEIYHCVTDELTMPFTHLYDFIDLMQGNSSTPCSSVASRKK